ncbi:mitochondrial heat shock protein HSP10 [Acrasis kona]|uniref:Mitochondrial heat shock protein HSP10 n=1 Tax=Acrasis kona TaxID=1008807 RepID=A0AAW2YKD0_9EUKA
MSRRLIPLFDRVLVKRIKLDVKPAQIGGVFIPESAAKNTGDNATGEVIAVGDGIEDKKATLKIGDKVLLPNYAGAPIKFSGEEYDMYREDEILAKIEN